MRGQAKVIVITVELSLMAGAPDIAVHCLQLQVHSFEIIVHPHSRHIQQATFIKPVTVEEIITERRLQMVCHKIAGLHITTHIVRGSHWCFRSRSPH